jgi:tetratricopeptide (TPR) repeat protein
MIQLFCRLMAGVAVLGVLQAEEGKIPITTSSPEAREQFLAGQVLVDNLRLTDAIPHFQKAVQLDSGFALAQLYLAQTAPTPKEFFAHLKEAGELSAKVSEGERLWIKGVRAGAYADLEGQLKTYKELSRIFPRNERAQTLLGIAYFAQQNYTPAAENLKHATEVNPAFAPAYNQLGYAYRFLGRYADAEQVFRKYTELIPDDPNPYDSYAELLLKMGKFDECIIQYRKALEINRYFANSYAGIAAAFVYQGRHQQAREALATALDLARTDGERRAALFVLTVVDLDEGKIESALAEVQKQYELGKNTNDVAAMAGDLILRGNILLEEGNAADAMKEFAEAAKMIKQSDLAAEVRENAGLIYHYNAGRAAVGMHDLATAAKEASAFRKGVEAKKNVNQIRLTHELDGLIAMESGEYQKAVDCLLQSNLQNPYNLYRVALAYQALGDTTKARDYSRQAALFNVLPQPNYAFVRMKARKMMDTL